MRDEFAAAVLILTLAVWMTVHGSLSWKLARVPPRWRGAAAFVVAPMAPYWGWRAGLRARATLWIVALLGWGLARVLLR